MLHGVQLAHLERHQPILSLLVSAQQVTKEIIVPILITHVMEFTHPTPLMFVMDTEIAQQVITVHVLVTRAAIVQHLFVMEKQMLTLVLFALAAELVWEQTLVPVKMVIQDLIANMFVVLASIQTTQLCVIMEMELALVWILAHVEALSGVEQLVM